MKLIMDYLFIIITCGFLVGTLSAQPDSHVPRQIVENIKSELQSQHGQQFLVSAYHQQLSPEWKTKLGFEDPYGTLSDCYIFLARPFRPKKGVNPNGFVGIYKSGSLIWHSEREISPDIVVNMELLGSMDLNRDGQVELITEWYMGMRGGNTDLWIYSWDGTSGQRINHLAKEGKSIIEATAASVEIVDIEPDGIKEIIGEDRASILNVYSWNGQEYGDWGVMLSDRLPRNAIKVLVSAKISLTNNKLRYKYRVDNSDQSLQSIEEFALTRLVNKNQNDTTEEWTFQENLKHSLMTWQIEGPLGYHRNALLDPGEYTEFYLLSNGLPKPAKYYVKGNNGDLTFSVEEILNNSVDGTTIVPTAPPHPFDARNFTDSLLFYTNQACALKWISNPGTCRSLESKLENVDRQLRRGNTNTAANTLRAFLNEVEALKQKQLSSEAYALLRFNGEYLLERLGKE